MSFLSAWFLLLGGAALVPLLIHLLRRKIGVQVRFLSRVELDKLAGNAAHQGLVAVTSAKQYNDLDDLLDRIDEAFGDEDEEDEEPLGGGYYSKN